MTICKLGCEFTICFGTVTVCFLCGNRLLPHSQGSKWPCSLSGGRVEREAAPAKYPHQRATPLHYLIGADVLCSERGRYWVFPLPLQTGTYFYTWQTADVRATFRQSTWSQETTRPFIKLSKLSRQISGSAHPQLQYHKAISGEEKRKAMHTQTQEQKSQDTGKYQQKKCSICNLPYSHVARLLWGAQQRIWWYHSSGHHKLYLLRNEAKL